MDDTSEFEREIETVFDQIAEWEKTKRKEQLRLDQENELTKRIIEKLENERKRFASLEIQHDTLSLEIPKEERIKNELQAQCQDSQKQLATLKIEKQLFIQNVEAARQNFEAEWTKSNEEIQRRTHRHNEYVDGLHELAKEPLAQLKDIETKIEDLKRPIGWNVISDIDSLTKAKMEVEKELTSVCNETKQLEPDLQQAEITLTSLKSELDKFIDDQKKKAQERLVKEKIKLVNFAGILLGAQKLYELANLLQMQPTVQCTKCLEQHGAHEGQHAQSPRPADPAAQVGSASDPMQSI